MTFAKGDYILFDKPGHGRTATSTVVFGLLAVYGHPIRIVDNFSGEMREWVRDFIEEISS